MVPPADVPIPVVRWCPVACPACGSQRAKNLRRVTPEARRCVCRDCRTVFLAVSDIIVWPKADRAVRPAAAAPASARRGA
jgi:hypothetical protein